MQAVSLDSSFGNRTLVMHTAAIGSDVNASGHIAIDLNANGDGNVTAGNALFVINRLVNEDIVAVIASSNFDGVQLDGDDFDEDESIASIDYIMTDIGTKTKYIKQIRVQSSVNWLS